MGSKSETNIQNQANEIVSWNYQKLDKKIIEMKSGFACARKNAVSNGIPHLRPFNIGLNGELDISKIIHIPNNFQTNVNEYYLEPGDIIFNNTNSVELVGKSIIIRNSYQGGFSNHLTRLRILNTNKLDPSWLLVCLRVLWLRGFFVDNCNKWIGQAAFNPTKLAELNIPLPDIDIQRRIVVRIETLLAEVKDSRNLLEKMRQDTQRVINLALEETIQSISLDRKTLLEVIKSKPRNGWSPKCDDNPNGISVLKLGAVLRFRYNPNEFKKTTEPVDWNAHYWLKPGDILISRSNTPELVGNAAIYSGEPSPCIYPDLLMRMTIDKLKADSRFLIYWLQTKEVRDYIKSHASGASSTMKKITQSDVCNIPFPNISLEEQVKLTSYLKKVQNEVDRMLKGLEQDAKLLDLLEQSILERAFRGEL